MGRCRVRGGITGDFPSSNHSNLLQRGCVKRSLESKRIIELFPSKDDEASGQHGPAATLEVESRLKVAQVTPMPSAAKTNALSY
jgi:hypothetical protein